MKKTLKFLPFLLLLLFPFLAFSQWTKVADLPQYKWRLAGFSIGTKGYIVGGITETATTFTGANPSANLWIYDSQTNTWSAGPDFPGGNIRRAFVFVINDIAYVGCGENTGFYAYDPSTNTWTQKANRPNVGEFYQAIGFSVNGVGYAGMGGSANLYKYTPSTNTWSTAIATGIPTRGSAFVFVYNNKAYIGGGNNGGTYYNTFYQFDPATNTSTQLANHPLVYTLYGYGFSTAQGGGVASGYAGYNNHHSYNVASNTWVAETPIPSSPQWGTQKAAGFNIGSDLYIIGGTTGSTALNRTIKFTSVVLSPTITALSPNPVTTGQTLTITGTNFTGATSVTINGTSVPFTVASATSITLTVPLGTVSGKVVVTTPGGTADGTVQIGANTTAPVTTGWTNAWQTLTTTSAGYLKTVTLQLDNTHSTNDYDLYLELHERDDNPGVANPQFKFNSLLETSATRTLAHGTSMSEVTFSFPGTVKLNANATYFVKLKEAASNPGGTGNQGISKLSSTSGTTDGAAGNNFGTLYYKFSMAPHLTVINPPAISVTSNLTNFETCETVASANQSFDVHASHLTAPLGISAPAGFEISTNASTGFASSLTLNPSSAVAILGSTEYCYISPDASSGKTTVHVDMRQFTSGVLPEEVGYLQLLDLYTGPATFIYSDAGGWARYSIPVDLSNISASAYTANFRSLGYGETAITVDFQFSPSNTLNLPIYVRLAASATGSPSGNVTLSSTGATSVHVAVNGTVNAKPAVPVVSNVTACQDLSLPNTFISALTATGTNLLWYTSATGGVGSTTAPTPSASTPGTTSYWVTQTNSSGCESDRAQIDVHINPMPTVNQPNNVLVQNGTTIPTVTFTGAVNSATYAWTSSNTSFGLGASGTGSIPSFTANYTGSGGVQQVVSTVVVTPSANGCVGTSKTFTITVNLNAPPTDISLSKANLFEANALGATVGNLSSTDPDLGDTHSYELVGGSGGGDNASFTIVGNQLKANAVFNFAAKRLYAVRIRTTDAGGLPYEKEFLISISKTPIVLGTGNVPSTKKQTAPSANPSISKGYSSFLTVIGENLTGYSWSPGIGLSANNITNPVASPAQTTTYNVTVTNSFGSTTVVPITITVLPDYNVTPSNLLTPNGDGINDTWAIENIASYPNNEIKIVDKAGRLVFTQKGYANTWDGATLTPDTYYYIIIFGPDVAPKKGFITIVR